jgi:hypothetical protein
MLVIDLPVEMGFPEHLMNGIGEPVGRIIGVCGRRAVVPPALVIVIVVVIITCREFPGERITEE